MNEKRRNKLRGALDYIIKACNIIDEVSEEERDSLDNIPENLQGTERYETMEDAADSLDEASESLSDAAESVENAINA